MSSEEDIGSFLEQRVWPELDAVASGLLEELKPQRNGNSYKLACPSCGKRRAYYYPTKAIKCNRIDSCGYASSIWSYLLEHQNLSRKEVVQTVCRAVGIDPPDSTSPKPSKSTSTDYQVIRILQENFGRCSKALHEKWSYTDDQISLLSKFCGYYPTVEEVRSKLPASLHAEAERLGWFKPSLENRLFGWWKQPSGSAGYWARSLGDAEPKYLFRSGMKKTIPYLASEASPSSRLMAVEGARDVFALKMMGFKNVIGVGGAMFNLAQCRYIADTHHHVIHVVDGDLAGLKGIVQTLENALEFGLKFEFVIIPSESGDDPDDYRRNKNHDDFHRLYANRLSAGSALGLAYAKLSSEAKFPDMAGKILSVRASLPPGERQNFDVVLRQFGIALQVEKEAIDDLSKLLCYFSLEEANSLIAKRYGISIEIIKAQDDG